MQQQPFMRTLRPLWGKPGIMPHMTWQVRSFWLQTICAPFRAHAYCVKLLL